MPPHCRYTQLLLSLENWVPQTLQIREYIVAALGGKADVLCTLGKPDAVRMR